MVQAYSNQQAGASQGLDGTAADGAYAMAAPRPPLPPPHQLRRTRVTLSMHAPAARARADRARDTHLAITPAVASARCYAHGGHRLMPATHVYVPVHVHMHDPASPATRTRRTAAHTRAQLAGGSAYRRATGMVCSERMVGVTHMPQPRGNSHGTRAAAHCGERLRTRAQRTTAVRAIARAGRCQQRCTGRATHARSRRVGLTENQRRTH